MKEPIQPYAVYTTEEVAKVLSLQAATIQDYIRKGKLNATKIGGKWYRISGQALLDFMSLGQLDMAALQLEYALCELDLGRPFKAGVVEETPFYNLGATVIKRIAEVSPTRKELLYNLARFIRETKGFWTYKEEGNF